MLIKCPHQYSQKFSYRHYSVLKQISYFSRILHSHQDQGKVCKMCLLTVPFSKSAVYLSYNFRTEVATKQLQQVCVKDESGTWLFSAPSLNCVLCKPQADCSQTLELGLQHSKGIVTLSQLKGRLPASLVKAVTLLSHVNNSSTEPSEAKRNVLRSEEICILLYYI